MNNIESILFLDGKPHYDLVYEILSDFIDEDIDYPLDFKELCRKKGWGIEEYTWFNKEFMDVSEDGFSTYKNGKYTIYYNSGQNPKRIRFTFAHEIGHIVLYHHLKTQIPLLARNGIIENDCLEKEANCFARNLLAPAYLVRNLNKNNIDSLSEIFNVSKLFMSIRMNFLHTDYCRLKHSESTEMRFDDIASIVNDFECDGEYFS